MSMSRDSSSLADYRHPSGSTLGRLRDYHDWQTGRRNAGSWAFDKTLAGPPLVDCNMLDGCGRKVGGPNFCSQDYLSLANSERVHEAAIHAIKTYGVHSAGSSALLGNTELSRLLETELKWFLGYGNVLLFPTGWAAGYGVIKGLIRQDDWIVMDVLSHACLQEGARSATSNVVSVPHLSCQALEQRLCRIRDKHPNDMLLVVSESLFSMDSDSPDLGPWLSVCRKYGAISLVDVAHDLGCLGDMGRGVIEKQKVCERPDILIGSFSKTFASNGGFISTNSEELFEYLKMFSCPQTFSNAMSPIQSAVVRESLNIVRGEEGKTLRKNLLRLSVYLRNLLRENEFNVLGEPSAIVPVFLGNDAYARSLWRTLSDIGIASNFVEYPGVAVNKSRIRLQLQTTHKEEHAQMFVHALVKSRNILRSKHQRVQDFAEG